jgi:hypothetical protein
MANGGLMATAIVLGFLVLVGMHWYYPQNALSQVVDKAAFKSMSTEFAMGSVVAFSVGILIEYSIVVFAIYFFLRGITKSFDRQGRY